MSLSLKIKKFRKIADPETAEIEPYKLLENVFMPGAHAGSNEMFPVINRDGNGNAIEDRTEDRKLESPRSPKFQNFSITLNLREINFGDSKSAKTAVLYIFKGCEFFSYGKFQPSKK